MRQGPGPSFSKARLPVHSLTAIGERRHRLSLARRRSEAGAYQAEAVEALVEETAEAKGRAVARAAARVAETGVMAAPAEEVCHT